MDVNTTMVVVAATSGIIGMALGALLISRGIRPKSHQQLESQLLEAEKKLKEQNAQITGHLTQTASLAGNLAKSYCDLHDYLTSSAQQLCNIDIQPILGDNSKSVSILGQWSTMTPPLDYATKKSDVGTLNENYGLKNGLPEKSKG